MKEFTVQIVTPDGEIFSGEAKSITVKTESGEVQIMRGHANYLATLSTGVAKLVLNDGSERKAAASGGFIVVSDGEARVIATTFEFADQIDIDRAKLAKNEAEERLASAKDAKEIMIANAKLARAISRISAAESK